MKKVIGAVRLVFIIGALLCSGMTLTAQQTVDAALNGVNDFRLNGYQLDNNLSLVRLQTKLGEADEEVEQLGTERLYKYNDLGLTVITMDGEVKGFALNFNWDGDKKVTETALNGSLTIMGKEITADLTQEELSQIVGMKVDCGIPSMCALGDREDKLAKMVAFNKEGKVTQVLIVLAK